MAETKKSNYLSNKESKAILKYNLQQMKFYEKEKRITEIGRAHV